MDLPAPDLSIVIVSWNVAALLRDCLSSVDEAMRAGGLRGEVIVVDNASSDRTVETVEGSFPEARLLVNSANLGFTRANNQGLRLAAGRHLLLLNPDTRLSPDSLCEMVSYLDVHPKVGAVGPRLVFPDGALQSSRRRFPTAATAFLESTPLQRFFPDSAVLRRYYCADVSPDEIQQVDWLVGACLCVRAVASEQVGLLDERFFMYSEEIDWCKRLKDAGWEVVYLPTVRVLHYEAKSSDQNTLSRHKHFHDSKVAYFDKHHGRAVAAAIRLFVVFSFAFMLVEESVKVLLAPRKRALHRARLRPLAAALLYHSLRLVQSPRRAC